MEEHEKQAASVHDGVSPIIVTETEETAELLTKLLVTAGDEGRIDDFLCSALCACAVTWVKQNPEVLAPLEADYNR